MNISMKKHRISTGLWVAAAIAGTVALTNGGVDNALERFPLTGLSATVQDATPAEGASFQTKPLAQPEQVLEAEQVLESDIMGRPVKVSYTNADGLTVVRYLSYPPIEGAKTR